MSRFLVNTPQAEQWLTLAATETGSEAIVCGNSDNYSDAESSAALLNASIALRDGVRTIEALNLDRTRTDPLKHEAASKVSANVVGKLEHAKATVERRASALYASGVEEADAAFAPNLNRSHLDAEIIRYVREESAKPDGIVKVHGLVRSNRNVASVVYGAESFLLGIAEPTHTRMKFDAVEHHVPAAYKRMTDSLALRELPAKLDAAANSVRRSFHNPGIAAGMATRVQGLD